MKRWLCLIFLALASCQTTSDHQFATPSPAWTTKSGQLSYQSPTVSLIGEILVRYSKDGAMEFTFSKGPGVNLLVLRQDTGFGSATGPMARGSWAGPVAEAPEHLRGWFVLREQIVAGRKSIQTKAGDASFNLRF